MVTSACLSTYVSLALSVPPYSDGGSSELSSAVLPATNYPRHTKGIPARDPSRLRDVPSRHLCSRPPNLSLFTVDSLLRLFLWPSASLAFRCSGRILWLVFGFYHGFYRGLRGLSRTFALPHDSVGPVLRKRAS